MAGSDSAVNVLAQGSSPIDTVQYTTGFGTVQRQRIEVGSFALTNQAAANANNAAATVTIAAVAGKQHHLNWLAFSFAATPTLGYSISFNGQVTVQVNYPTSVVGQFYAFGDQGVGTATNGASSISLSAGGTGVVGFVGVGYIDY